MKKILIVDDSKFVRNQLKALLEKENNYEVIEAGSGTEAFNILKNVHDISLITLDVEMPGRNGFQILSTIKTNKKLEHYQNVPVLIVTGHDTFEDRIKGFDLGAVDFISKPFKNDEFIDNINQKINRTNKYNDLKVLVIENNVSELLLIEDIVSSIGVEVITAVDGTIAMEILQNDNIDLIITDLIMKEMNGDELIYNIRSHSNLKEISIIVLTAYHSSTTMLNLFKQGVSDYVVKPFAKEEFLARIKVNLDNIRQKKALENLIEQLSKANNEIQLKQEALIHLEKKNSILAMSATANHEINQPLTIIQFNAEMIKMKLEEIGMDKKFDKYFSTMQSSIKDISKILEKFRTSKDFDITEYVKSDNMVSFKNEG